MDDDQQFCLRWNNHQSTLISVFDTLLENETLVDCTLAAEGKFLKAHKVVLSACSPYFATLLQEQYDKHPIFILKDVKYQELRAMMDYMYRGEVNISQDQLTALLKAAESLQIKGLSDNRSGTGPAAAAAAQQQQQAPKPDTHHRVKLSAPYTLEQTKRARVTTGGAAVGVGGMVDAGDVAGSREGSSSPSRRRRKVRRRSMENDMHDNSNSSVLAAASNQSILQQTSAGLAASALVSTQLASGSGAASATVAAAASSGTGSQVINQPLTSSSSSSSNVTKKTESAKLTSTAAAQGAQQQQQQQQQQQTTSDAINTDNVQQQQNQGAQGEAEEMDVASGGAASGAVAVHPGVVKQLTTLDKSNHKQKIKDNSITTTEMVIEPKAEYDDDAHDENVEDLTLDEEDMTMEELDQAAGTSQGGEGSSQAYATWQHDRSQDELGLMAAQDAQQRDPQDDNGQQDSGESRIRVRNWLMLADQSMIGKNEETDKLTPSKKPNINAAKNTNNACTKAPTTPATISTTPSATTRTLNNITNSSSSNNNSSNIINNNNVVGDKISGVGSSSSSCLPVLDPKTQTVTRIGSIGRTTIACITPASSLKNSSSNCNVDAASAAALAAAGVELDSIDDAMTEVIVKIENPENVSLNGDEAVCNEAIDDENTFDYDLKLASPLSWTYDAVKIENEEFEDSYLMDNDDDDDDLLTTAAASQKHAKQSNEKQQRSINSSSNNNNGSNSNKIVLSTQQQQQLLLEQQQHLQHLQLQPTSQSLQIKLPTIPATITTIAAAAPQQKQPVASTSNNSNVTSANSTLLSSKLGLNMDAQNMNLHWSHTDDNRYRILVQNKRMRKESLEHSADMIYNADIEKPWVCRNCNRTYKWKNSLKCHLKNECGLPPRYFCSKMCGYATNVHSNLKRHLNTKCRDREKDEEEKEKEKDKDRKLAPVNVNLGNHSNSNSALAGNGGSNNASGNTNANNNSSNSNSSTYTLVFQNE
ncbi:longitudinals lacking protein, isoforms J/P/Q/S/Z isoform X2 [Drosophila mojavensis]|uniref:longitudinals lacking protein, isoforms J/P/Q/S/Z isoform X2 n=1 Tax=Drosophila mojavensis TaxID=7230 RepID=UPI0013EE8121|nr:longitudinals lacking protein, isoforms J/P/Q/S/Z isoform X2 [Drosophila mojavensis]